MAWHNLTDEARKTILALTEAAGKADTPEGAAAHAAYDEMLQYGGELTEAECAFASAARNNISDPDQIDDDVVVSASEDGAYVMAWIWVDNSDAGICRTCGEAYEEGGDGYDGECPDCADKTDQELHPENYSDQ